MGLRGGSDVGEPPQPGEGGAQGREPQGAGPPAARPEPQLNFSPILAEAAGAAAARPGEASGCGGGSGPGAGLPWWGAAAGEPADQQIAGPQPGAGSAAQGMSQSPRRQTCEAMLRGRPPGLGRDRGRLCACLEGGRQPPAGDGTGREAGAVTMGTGEAPGGGRSRSPLPAPAVVLPAPPATLRSRFKGTTGRCRLGSLQNQTPLDISPKGEGTPCPSPGSRPPAPRQAGCREGDGAEGRREPRGRGPGRARGDPGFQPRAPGSCGGGPGETPAVPSGREGRDTGACLESRWVQDAWAPTPGGDILQGEAFRGSCLRGCVLGSWGSGRCEDPGLPTRDVKPEGCTDFPVAQRASVSVGAPWAPTTLLPRGCTPRARGVEGPGWCFCVSGGKRRAGRPAAPDDPQPLTTPTPDCPVAPDRPHPPTARRPLHADCPQEHRSTPHHLWGLPAQRRWEDRRLGEWEGHRGGGLRVATAPCSVRNPMCFPTRPVLCPGLGAGVVGPGPGPPASRRGGFWENLQRCIGRQRVGPASPGGPAEAPAPARAQHHPRALGPREARAPGPLWPRRGWGERPESQC
ncbi:translation initiation factor IF-2-like [Canis lupus familiaris]|uniref:translation initiation factor IF-2-like n=1 Tax=Canis lupus familiaris TaxID=9615 RepID=UPI0018F5F548|nr:translation initiation factor IF-2-like [Canis lupus familiaris]